MAGAAIDSNLFTDRLGQAGAAARKFFRQQNLEISALIQSSQHPDTIVTPDTNVSPATNVTVTNVTATVAALQRPDTIVTAP